MQIYDLAFLLRKSVGEVLDLPAQEVAGWTAYFNLRNRKAT